VVALTAMVCATVFRGPQRPSLPLQCAVRTRQARPRCAKAAVTARFAALP